MDKKSLIKECILKNFNFLIKTIKLWCNHSKQSSQAKDVNAYKIIDITSDLQSMTGAKAKLKADWILTKILKGTSIRLVNW